MKLRFSIIVPVYNVEFYIRECLESIRMQTFDEFECIIVNDGSTDNSMQYAKDICSLDMRFVLYNKENGGLSDARNYGLEKACGDFLVFIDSDDVVNSSFLSCVNKAIEKEDCDVVYIDFVKFKDGFDFTSLTERSYEGSYHGINNRKLAQKPNFAWSRIVNRNIYINNLFPVGVIYEDVVTSSIMNERAKKIIHIDAPLYLYRKRIGSITTFSAEKQFLLFESVDILKSKMEQGFLDKSYFDTALVNLIQSCLVSLVRIKTKKAYKNYAEIVCSRYRSLGLKNIWCSYSDIKFKFLASIATSKVLLGLFNLIFRMIVAKADRRFSE